ncbi:hypothetical protein [Ruegeria sp. MALMAid1280]|uniref:ApeP family dehydratase n=1 Tax=Ruegeria sp. MALMAid1280 TaxID=3411634 RepID=UPI003B9EC3B8
MTNPTPDLHEDIVQFMPHDRPMALLDRLVEAQNGRLKAEVRIESDSMFYRPDEGVPSYLSLEYMAQAVAALDGFWKAQRGSAPSIGFLLGTRAMPLSRPFFDVGEVLTVTVEERFNDGNMASFDGRVDSGSETVASATLNVFSPDGSEVTKESEDA